MSRFSDQDPESRWHELEIAIPGDTAPNRSKSVSPTIVMAGPATPTGTSTLTASRSTARRRSGEQRHRLRAREHDRRSGRHVLERDARLRHNRRTRADACRGRRNNTSAIVGQLGIVDPDADDDAGYAVSDNRFEVTPDGVLKLRDGVTLDHETEPVVSVEVIGTEQRRQRHRRHLPHRCR